MSALSTDCGPLVEEYSKSDARLAHPPERPSLESLATGVVQPNVLVRWAFYISIFALPFTRFYLPGTGDRLGVIRLVQALIACAVLSQPRVCLRLLPVALLWALAYCGVRIAGGLWLSPEMSAYWWPTTHIWLQFLLPWTWVMFNVLQFPGMGRNGLLAFVTGVSLCAACHLAGIGVVELAHGIEGRSSVFGENANVVGATYAVAGIVLIGLGLLPDLQMRQRLLLLPPVALVMAALAKTGSRGSFLVLLLGIAVLFWQGQAFGSKLKRLATVVLIGVVLAGIVSQVPTVMERFEKLDASNLREQEGRARMIPVMWEIFLRSPVHGSGPDAYQMELTRRAMPHLLKEQRMITTHNLALKLLVETGLIGFVLFAGCVKAGLVSAWKARLAPCGSLPLALFLPLVIAGMIVAEPSYYLVFWLALTYALAGRA